MELQSTSESVNAGETLTITSTECFQSQNFTENYSCDMDTVSDKSSKTESYTIMDSLCSGCDNNSVFHNLKGLSDKQSNMAVHASDESSITAARCAQVQTDSSQPSLNCQQEQKQIFDSALSECVNSSPSETEPTESNDTEDLSNSNDSMATHLPEQSSSDSPVSLCCQTETVELTESPYDIRRTRRNGKRKSDSAQHCPVCGVTVRLPELQSHFTKEVENLTKIHRNSKRQRREEVTIKEPFVQVKNNRENRLTAKVARYAARAKSEVQCPVCSLRMSGTQEEVNRHVLNCISQDRSSDEYIAVDDDDESFEEYEFADQTRIRTISLVPGGYKTLHGNSTRQRTTDDEEYLNVDVDDTQTYGQPQYTELDVIPNATDDSEDKELEQLRKAVLVDPTARPHVLESRKWSTHGVQQEDHCDQTKHVNEQRENSTLEINGGSTDEEEKKLQANHVVSSLKEKIRDLEEQNKSVKCLICMEPYTKPVVSTTCWHVHCEECWLMTMGVKKLCPQCNMIVFPTDLRRIYL